MGLAGAKRMKERGEYRRNPDIHSRIKLLSPLLVIGAWELASRLGMVNSIFLPPPSVIVWVWIQNLTRGPLFMDILISLKRVVLGFLLGVSLGLVATITMALSRSANLFLDSLITLLYPIPKVAILPLLLIWLGSGELTKIVIIASGSFFPVTINAYSAIQDINPVLIRAGRNLGASGRQIFYHVLLPASLPSFYTGAVLGAGLSLILLVYAEMTAANSGVGYFTYTAASLFEPEKAFAGVLTLALLGWVWHRIITSIEAFHCPWRNTFQK